MLKAAGMVAVAGFWSDTLFSQLAMAAEEKTLKEEPREKASPIGQEQIIKGLDGMSRVAEPGNNTFVQGHGAAAVISSAFFCRDEKLDHDTQKEMLSLMEARLLRSRIYEPREKEKAEPELVQELVKDLDAGIDSLRRSGHNIIFTVLSLKALSEVPQAATPKRIAGLRRMIQSFGSERERGPELKDKDTFVDLSDEKKFIRFIFQEYLKALDLYLHGKGHHGFAGHVLTVGHAMLELKRMGHEETARKGVEAYWQFIQQARNGANLRGRKVADGPADSPRPLSRDYWVEQTKRGTGSIVSSHLIKYPYSLYALAKDLGDDELKQRVLDKIYHLTAVS